MSFARFLLLRSSDHRLAAFCRRPGAPMLRSPIVRLVELCTRTPGGHCLCAGLAAFALLHARHFAIATDIKQLFPTELPGAARL